MACGYTHAGSRHAGSRQMISPSKSAKVRRAFLGLLVTALIAATVVLFHSRQYIRSAELMKRIENPETGSWFANSGAYAVRENPTTLSTPAGPIRARLYLPQGLSDAPGIMIAHGVHYLGIDEPRLMAFARALASSGIRVLTPELLPLADYHIEPGVIDLIGYSACEFSKSLGRKAGVLGISFGGGLALMAAAEPRFEPCIGFVVSVGAHDDLERVARFYVTNRIARPDGSILQMKAHEYGALNLIYSHVEDFFPATDVSVARQTLKLLLWEKVEAARKEATQLGPESQKKMELIFSHDRAAFANRLEASIARHRDEMAAVSPHGHLSSLHVPVLLLHGAADNIVPPSELLWLKNDIPAADVKDALISPAISHVDVEGKPTWKDRLRIVAFMAEILRLSDEEKAVPAETKR